MSGQLKLDPGTIQGTVISNDLPEVMESISSSITDDSKAILEDTAKKVSSCNKKLKSGIKKLNTYIDSMAEAFAEADSKAAKLLEQNTTTMNATKKTTNKKGYRNMLP